MGKEERECRWYPVATELSEMSQIVRTYDKVKPVERSRARVSCTVSAGHSIPRGAGADEKGFPWHASVSGAKQRVCVRERDARGGAASAITRE